MRSTRLSEEQKRICREIRRLLRRNEPLNITAVKRRHPELIAAAFAVEPFWGWKAALESAGAPYGSFRIELEDLVTCQICGIERRRLTTHMVKVHQIPFEEYHATYPEHHLRSETDRAAVTRMKSSVLPHWEPIWSREYVLDRIWEFHRRGIGVHELWVRRNEPSFERMGQFLFGRWYDAVRLVGLDPSEITAASYRSHRRYPDPASVMAEIKRRRREGLTLYHNDIAHGDTPDVALTKGGIEFFGSWKKTLLAAGINHHDYARRVRQTEWRYPTKASVRRAIKRRRRLGKPINSSLVPKGKDRDIALYKTAKRLFGSWNAALADAGFDVREITAEAHRRRARYPDRDAVIREIRLRHNLGQALLIQSKKVKPDSALKDSARMFFGSWRNAVRDALGQQEPS